MQVITGPGVRKHPGGRAMAQRVRAFAYSRPILALSLYSDVYGPMEVQGNPEEPPSLN